MDKDMVSPLGGAFLEQDSLSSIDDEGTNFLGDEGKHQKQVTWGQDTVQYFDCSDG